MKAPTLPKSTNHFHQMNESSTETDSSDFTESMDGSMSFEELTKLSYSDLLTLADHLDVVDNGFEGRDDLIERIILTHNKQQRNSFNPFDKFTEVQKDICAKCDALRSILQSLYKTFSQIPTGPLSDVLLKERLLKNSNLLLELKARIKAIEERKPLIIIAGETNGGKSSFLNVILGVKILPTDVLHCTIAICKIKYSRTYSIETLDRNDQTQYYSLDGWQAAHEKLKILVAQEDMYTREKGSAYKEITLKMPSPILESGVTLVDTPGIGETTQMDNVTLDYIRSTRASAFIYVIKSDAAGGVQEDRLISFLRAIQEDYRNDSVEGAIDPRSALFICNRWDAISEEGVEKVKKNALTRLDIVWPGFHPDQLFFFSSKKTQLHLDADPDFVTEKLNGLMMGLRKLFSRAANNNIQHQYRWAKYLMQPSSSHLSSMINHCISSNEELEDDFRMVASKQETLMKDSKEDSIQLQDTLAVYEKKLKQEVIRILSEIKPSDMDDYQQLISLCSGDKFLHDSNNRQTVDQWIVSSIIHYSDKVIQETGVLADMERDTKNKIKEHMGLFEEQIKEITELVKGNTDYNKTDTQGSDASLSSSGRSVRSLAFSINSFEMEGGRYIDLTQLDHAVGVFLGKRKKKSFGVLKSLPKVKSKIMKTIRSGTLYSSAGKDYKHPSAYIEYCIKKNADLMKDNDEIIDGFVSGYLRIVNMYIQSAVARIPHFIEVNNELMDNIREHRKAFQEDKCKMRDVMVALEPIREQLQGYGLLYMEDLNADSVVFNSKRTSLVLSSLSMGESVKPSDSGFLGSGSTRSRVRGFWVHLRNAVIQIDNKPEEVTIKTYTFHMDKSHQLREIASLRCLEHTNLAEFFGMSRISINSTRSLEEELDSCEKVSAFIFTGTLVSARVYKSNQLIVFRDFVKFFLHGLLSGLEFIHRENMVHLELNLDTVMVDRDTGIVKLCQQCLPREVQLPEDLSIATNASICLSPSVLQGDEYGICDDIYAFGLLLWELVFPDTPPYFEQRQWPLHRFISEVFPSKMLGPEIAKLQASDAVIKVLQGSLISGKGRICMAMTEIKSFMEEVKKDPVINGFHCRRGAVKSGKLGMLHKGSEIHEDSQPQRPPRKSDGKRLQRYSTIPSCTKSGMSSQYDNHDAKSVAPQRFSESELQGSSTRIQNSEQHKENRRRKVSLPNLDVSSVSRNNGYQSRKLSVPNINVTLFEGDGTGQDFADQESRRASDLILKYDNESKMERIYKHYKKPLNKQAHIDSEGELRSTSPVGMFRGGTNSIPDNLHKLGQSDHFKKDKKSLLLPVPNKFSDSACGNKSGSPARIMKKVKKLSFEKDSMDDSPSFPRQTEQRGSKMTSHEESSSEDNTEDCLVTPTNTENSPFSPTRFIISNTDKSYHNQRPVSFMETDLLKSSISNSSNVLNSGDSSDPVKLPHTSSAFPSGNENSQVRIKYKQFKDILKSSSSGDSDGSSGNSRINSSFFSDGGKSSAYSSIRSCSSGTSDFKETKSLQKGEQYGSALEASQSSNGLIGDLMPFGALPSPANVDDFTTASAFPSLNQLDTLNNNNEGTSLSGDALPSFHIDPFCNNEANWCFDEENPSTPRPDDMPTLDLSDLNFMNRNLTGSNNSDTYYLG